MLALSVWLKRISYALLLLLMSIAPGCSSLSNVKTYDPSTGKLVKSVPQDVAALQAISEIQLSKIEMVKALGELDPEAQRYTVVRGDLWTDEMQSYIAGENAEMGTLQSFGGYGMWGFLGYAFANAHKEAVKSGGDSYGNVTVNATKSDDPVGSEGAVGTVNGSQVISIGRNRSATDRAQYNELVDKAIGTPLDGDSNFDGNGNPTGITIDDANDGSGNSGSLF